MNIQITTYSTYENYQTELKEDTPPQKEILNDLENAMRCPTDVEWWDGCKIL
jgi:hypothetical protein